MAGVVHPAMTNYQLELTIGEAKWAPGSKPLVEQIAHRPFAQLNHRANGAVLLHENRSLDRTSHRTFHTAPRTR